MFVSNDNEKIKMFKLFSMRDFRKKVTSNHDILPFAREETNQLVNWFCQSENHIAQWAEPSNERGVIYTSPPLFQEIDLRNGIELFKRHVFKKKWN